MLRTLVVEASSLFTNYHSAVQGRVRQAAIDEFDRHRRAVDATLFGAYADKITSAALSLDGRGLSSYGAYSITLREVAVSRRASILEENSFSFVQHHHILAGHPLPCGFRCAWQHRHELAVAKLADLIDPTTPDSEFPRILLRDTGDRKQDEFLEIHIYGSFNRDSIESVHGTSNPKNHEERAVVTVVKEFLIEAGKGWVEA